MDNELIARNVVKEIIKECDKHRIFVDPKFCTFYVELLMLDPNWGLSENIMEIRPDLQKFIDFVVDKLKVESLPSVVALNIQFHMTGHNELMDQVIREHRRDRGNMLEALRLSVMEPSFNDRSDLSELTRKIVYYLTLASGLGDPNEKLVYREVETVFKSVCNEEELKEFMNSLYTVRVEKLSHLVKVVSGIRLYNRYCQRGGEGIRDLPELLFRAIEAVKTYFETVISHTRKTIVLLVEVIQSCYRVNNSKGKVTLEVDLPKWATKDELEHYKSFLMVKEQYSEALGKLIWEVEKIKKASIIVEKNQNETLEFLHGKIIPNMHLRASFIFPVFESLYGEWVQFQDNIIRLMALKLFFEHLQDEVSAVKFDNSLVNNLKTVVVHHEIVHTPLSKEMMKPVKSGCKIFRKELIEKWCRQRYEFNGHCPWFMVLSKGALVKGNDDYGIAQYKRCFYIFSSPLGAQCFVRSPDYFIMHIFDMARKKCELILYLRIKNHLIEVQDQKEIVEFEKDHIDTRDKGIQLESDMMNTSIDPDYESNVWNLRRKALQMAYLTNCKTTSTQTERSFSRNCISLQTWDLKENGTQTKTDNYSDTPTPIRFFYGLRGRKDDKQLMLDLTYGELK